MTFVRHIRGGKVYILDGKGPNDDINKNISFDHLQNLTNNNSNNFPRNPAMVIDLRNIKLIKV